MWMSAIFSQAQLFSSGACCGALPEREGSGQLLTALSRVLHVEKHKNIRTRYTQYVRYNQLTHYSPDYSRLYPLMLTQQLCHQAFVELCLSAKVLDSSPLAPQFLGQPQTLWDGWDNVVAALGRKVRNFGRGTDTRVWTTLFTF